MKVEIKDIPHVVYRNIVFTCQKCKIEFTSKKAHKGWLPKFCSITCASKTGIKKNTPKGTFRKREVSCGTCEAKFITQSPKAKYCCKKCASIGTTKFRSCPQCLKQFPSDPQTKFCSQECFKKGRTSRRGTTLSDDWKKALSDGRKKSDKCKGPNLYNWKGGKATESFRLKIYSHNRRTKLKKKIDQVFIKCLYIAQRGRCFYCEKSLKEYKALEHLTSVADGGDNQNYNLVWSCKTCNSKKRTTSMEDYAIKIDAIYLVDKWDHIYSTALVIKDRVCCK